MQPSQLVIGGAQAFLARLIAAGGPLAGAKVKLFTAPAAPGPNSVAADFTFATFTGSAPVVVAAWEAPYVNPQGEAETNAGMVDFHWTALGPETILGWALTDAADVLLRFSMFDAPVIMADATDYIAFVPKVSCPQQGWGVDADVA